MSNSAKAIEQLNIQVEQYDELVRAGELQYQAGRRTLLHLVDMFENRYLAQERRADERYKLLTSRFRYMVLRGNFLPAMELPEY